jgi:hypothetical protein
MLLTGLNRHVRSLFEIKVSKSFCYGLWVVTPCDLAGDCRFGGTYRHHLQG